jgi:hypothetical protein
MILVSQPVTATGTYADEVIAESYCTNSSEALYTEDTIHATLGQNEDKPEIPADRIGVFVLEFPSNIPQNSFLWIHASSTLLEYYQWRLISDEGTESSWTYYCDDTDTTRFTTPTYPTNEAWVAIEIATQDLTLSGQTPTDPIYGSEIDAVEF